MVRDSDLVEDPMKLADNVVDLGGQVARVDRHSVQGRRCRKSPEGLSGMGQASRQGAQQSRLRRQRVAGCRNQSERETGYAG